MLRREGAAPVVAWLVPEVPEEDPPVAAVLREELLAHREKLLAERRIVHRRVAGHAREAAMLRELASAMVAEIPLLLPHRRQRPDRLRARTVVPEHEYHAHAVTSADLQHPVEALHHAVMLGAPHRETEIAEDDAHRIQPILLHERHLALHLLETRLAPVFLPLVHAVRAARRHVVAPAYPRLGAIPLPRLLLRPRLRAGRRNRRRRRARKNH